MTETQGGVRRNMFHLASGRRRAQRTPRPGWIGFRPCLEALEQRILPSLFGPAMNFSSAGAGPAALVAGNFTADSIADLAVLNSASNTVNVLVGAGNGTFGAGPPGSSLGPTNHSPQFLAAGDFNEDGRADLVVGNTAATGTSLQILLGNGSGVFGPGPTMPLPGAPRGLVVGQFNRDVDTHLDIAVTVAGQGLLVFFGNGVGGFPPPTVASSVPALAALAVGDFDNDTRADFAVVDASAGSVRIVHSNGDGTFAPGTPVALVGGATNPVSIASGDFDGNGRLDVVTANAGSSNASVFFGTGSRTAPQLTAGPVLGTGSNPQSVVTGNFNGDANGDLAIAHGGGLTVYTGGAAFALDAGYNLATNPASLAVGDFNGDGKTDLATANPGSDNIAVLLHSVASEFSVSAPPSAAAGAPFLITVTAVDGGGSTIPDYTGTITFTSSDPAAVLPGPYTFTTADNGSRTFSVTLFTAGPPRTITVSDGSNSGNTQVVVNAAAPHHLQFGPPIANASAGAAIAPPVTVLIVDPYGNLETTNSSMVTIALAGGPPGTPLNGTLTVQAVNGVATFANLSIDVAATGYRLAASATGLLGAMSNPFDVAAGAATHFSIGAPPMVGAGSSFDVMVVALDAFNNPVTTYAGTVRFASPDPNAQLPIDYTFTAGDLGQHLFTGVLLVTAGAQGIGVNEIGNPAIQGSIPVAVQAGPPAQLDFVVQPNGAATGQSLGPVEVHVEDAHGNLVTMDSNSRLTLTIGNNPGGGTLSGTTHLVVSGGRAIFNSLSLSRPGTGYTLAASTVGSPSVTSASFNIFTPTETEANQSPGTANPLSENGTMAGTISAADTDVFRITVAGTPLQLTALVSAGGAPVQLALLRDPGMLVIQSDGISPTNPDAEIVQILTPGTWYLRVNSSSAVPVAYTLFTTGTPALQTSKPLAPVPGPGNLLTADFNDDGIADLATVSADQGTALVFLGLGDSAFQPPSPLPLNGTLVALASGDFDNDGDLDLAVLSQQGASDMVLLLENLGDGVFIPGTSASTGSSGGTALVVGDFDGVNGVDVAIASRTANSISLLRNDGTGQLLAGSVVAPLTAPAALVLGDFNGDTVLDLAATTTDQDGSVAILIGNGDGTFTLQNRYTVGTSNYSDPTALVVGDFDGDLSLDLATVNGGSSDVSVLRGLGDGTFTPLVNLTTLLKPSTLVAADIDGNGLDDLVIGNQTYNNAEVLLSAGLGFTLDTTVVLGGGPIALAAADFDNDGRTDFASINVDTSDINVKIQRSDGTFSAPSLRVDATPADLVAADLNNDGSLDIVTVNQSTGTVSVLLGGGEGAFTPPTSFVVAANPMTLVAGDFNGDNRTDLATISVQIDPATQDASSTLSILLGLGTGSFAAATYTVFAHQHITSLAVGNFNGDTRTDLAIGFELQVLGGGGQYAAQGSYVNILNGLGNGSFQAQAATYSLPAGPPTRLRTGDLNGDSALDLVVLTGTSSSLLTVLTNANGTFTVGAPIAVGNNATDLLLAQLDSGTVLDAAVLNADATSQMLFLPGLGDGTFGPGQVTTFASVAAPLSFTAGDFTGDGTIDIAVADFDANRLYLLDGSSTGTFTLQPTYYSTGDGPLAPMAADFNNDHFTDIALVGQLIGDVSVFLNLRGSGLASATQAAVAHQATPLLGDLNGDGNDDVVVLASNGAILYRQATSPGTFGSALPVNDNPNQPGQLMPARHAALVRTATGTAIAAVNTVDDVLVLYQLQSLGGFTVTSNLFVGPLVTALAAADLNGDGLTDVVVTNSTNTAKILIQQPDGSFNALATPTLDVGFLASSIAFIDRGAAGLDIAVTGFVSGDVTIIRNNGGSFDEVERFRAGQGPYDVMQSPQGNLTLGSPEETAGVVAGNFDASPGSDLIAINLGTRSVTLLSGTGTGAYTNPQALAIVAGSAAAVVSGAFNLATPAVTYFAILDTGADRIHVFTPDGNGGFTEVLSPDINGALASLDAGNAPTGLATVDVDGDGTLDLLVGNPYGDVLVLLGNGDGTFQAYQRTGRNVALAAADLTGSGRDDLLLANESDDTLTLQSSAASFRQGRTDGVFAPGDVQFADLNGDGRQDLVAINSGGNNILVYLGAGGGAFEAARQFSVGTNPTGLTLSDLNSDGLADLIVANEGSNDVSILLSSGIAAGWSLTLGPRLRAGAGPVSTAVMDATGDGTPDLLVSNSLSNTLMVLPGVGGGFFNDSSPQTFNTGATPGQVLVGNFDGNGLGVVVLNTAASTLTFFSDFSTALPANSGITLSSGGVTPYAATAGDFTGDGFTDLLVVNNGSNTIAYFSGGGSGFDVLQTFSDPGLVNPTDLALSSDGLEFYVSEADSDIVFTFSLERPGFTTTLDESGAAVVSIPAGDDGIALSELVPVSDSPFESVAVLVPTSVQVGTNLFGRNLLLSDGFETEGLPFAEASDAEVSGETGVLFLLAQVSESDADSGTGGGGEDDGEEVEEEDEVPTKDDAALLRFLQNLDEQKPGEAEPPPSPPNERQPEMENSLSGFLPECGPLAAVGWGVQRWAETEVAAEPAGEPVNFAEVALATSFREGIASGDCPVGIDAQGDEATLLGKVDERQVMALAAPLLAAYFAREVLLEVECRRRRRWLAKQATVPPDCL